MRFYHSPDVKPGLSAIQALRQSPAVDYQSCTGDPNRHWAHEKQNCVGDVVRGPDAGERTVGGFTHESLHFLTKLGTLASQHGGVNVSGADAVHRSEEHTSELQSQSNLVCR